MLSQQGETPPHEAPVLLSYDIEEHAKKLEREVMYLLNKLRSHPPPKPKTTPTGNNASNTTKTTVYILYSEIFSWPKKFRGFRGFYSSRENFIHTSDSRLR